MTTKSEGRCGDWKAWHDNQPPGPKTLYVTGKCTFNTGGYSVQLKPHEPQGINPAIYPNGQNREGTDGERQPADHNGGCTVFGEDR